MSIAETKSSDQVKTQASTQAAGYLLGKVGLIGIALVMLLAAWLGQMVIVVLLGLLLATAGLSWLWSRLSLSGVSCQRSLSENRVFPDELVELKLRVSNRKLLPLPWIEVTDEIPVSFAADLPLIPGSRHGFGILSKNASLLWYSTINWKCRLLCNQRGYYPLGPLTVSSGDIFGFYPRTATLPLKDNLIVYPRLYAIRRLNIPSLYPLGETKSDNRIFEDPSRTIGVRDYSPGDSLRRIHWRASARQQQLQVKVFEPTVTLKAMLFLCIDTFQQSSEAEFELGVSTAASIVQYLVEHHSQVGLLSNSHLMDTGQPARIPAGSGEGQLVDILEALAKVTQYATVPMTEFLENERRNLPSGTTLIFVLSRTSVKINRLLADLAGSGYKLLVLQVGEPDKGELTADIAWQNIRHAGDLTAIGAEMD